jgi:hypothetical protein
VESGAVARRADGHGACTTPTHSEEIDMNALRSFAPAAAALFLLLGLAPSARAEAVPSPASSPAQAVPARPGAAQTPAEDYAAREAKAPELAKFEGGEHEHIYIGSSVVVVLLVILIVVLVI